MGEQDPDFKDQRAEADWIAQAMHGEVVMVPQAGHYPQSQRPDITTEAILRFLRRVTPGGVIGSQTPVLSTPDFDRVTVGS
jgi:hypothetical protein